MTAEKGNKVYRISENAAKDYQNMGFDIRDDGGNIVAYGRGKTVPYETYAAAVEEAQDWKEKYEALVSGAGAAAETEKEPAKRAAKRTDA